MCGRLAGIGPLPQFIFFSSPSTTSERTSINTCRCAGTRVVLSQPRQAIRKKAAANHA
jgi:hypothetical protein